MIPQASPDATAAATHSPVANPVSATRIRSRYLVERETLGKPCHTRLGAHRLILPALATPFLLLDGSPLIQPEGLAVGT